MQRPASDFCTRPVLEVAPELLGKYICTQSSRGQIYEVEAYNGVEDKACHASKGRTPRTEVLFGPAGYWYVYLCYGMHWMLNIVTGEEGDASAVLIRGVIRQNTAIDGPGKLTKAFGITGEMNGLLCHQQSGLWIEDRGDVISETQIIRTPRIGVDYAEEWAEKPYRFLVKSKM